MKRIHLVLGLAGLLLLLMSALGVIAAPPGQTTIPGNPTPDQTFGTPTYIEQVVELVNQERWNNGQLAPLKAVDLLHSSSQTHSDNMANRDFFAHCDLDTGTLPWDRMETAGYFWSSAGENIAAGYGTPVDVMVGWMNSSGHRANILSTSYREIGVGYTYQSSDQGNIRGDGNGDCLADEFNKGPYFRYWTQNFGKRSAVYPVVIDREAYEATTPQVALYMYGAGWATEMRFRNENGTWSNWQAYTPDINWTLSSGNGTKTVNAEIRNSTGEVRSVSDTIMLNVTVVEPIITVTPDTITVLRQTGSATPEQVTLTIGNEGTEPLTWSIAEQPAVDWLSVSSTAGSTDGGQTSTTVVTVNPQSLGAGHYTTQLQVSGNATNSPQTVSVTLIISDQLFWTYLPLTMRE